MGQILSVFDRFGKVHRAWANHFKTFGAQDADGILKDYTEDSEIVCYNMRSGAETRAKGLAAIKKFFEDLFKSMSDLSDLDAPVLDIYESPQGSVFVVWKCPASGFEYGADTFLFKGDKIAKQTVVLWKANPGDAGTSTNTEPTGGVVQKAWDNHFAAFGEQDLEKIKVDYTENSLINVFDITTGEKTTYKGMEGVEELFTGLFKTLSDTSDLGAPLIQVEEDPATVFLVWKCPASGFTLATDTFLFDDKGKIKYQNVVVESKKK